MKHNPAFDRLNDPAHRLSSAEKIRTAMGWHPTGSFAELVREMVELADATLRTEQ